MSNPIPIQKDSIQTLFLEQIRQSLPKNLSYADDLAEILNVSRDSIYRRIRGETVLSLEEVKKLSVHYKVSVDALLAQSSEVISFNRRPVDAEYFKLDQWFMALLKSLDYLGSFADNEIVYSGKDIAPPYYFKFPELALFKMFFWMKSYHRHPKYENAHYQPELVSNEYLTLGKKLWDKYASTPTVEIWSDETFNVTIRQVEFYLENGFITLAQAQFLLDEYLRLTNDIRANAAAGTKNGGHGTFRLYRNEFLISDTTFMYKMDEKRIAFITYHNMSLLSTSQEIFCKETEEYLNNIINKSTLISTTGERDRNKFFNLIEKRIQYSKEQLR